MAGPPPPDRARALAEQRRARNVDDPCDITLRVDLVGVRVEALPSLRLDMMLAVELRTEAPYSALVCCVPGVGNVVGTLAAFPGLSSLISCIQQGNDFVV
jgi:hypothetical protein